MSTEAYLHYEFRNAQASYMHRHFMPKVFELCGPIDARTRVLDVGCGNGFACGEFVKRGCQVVGVDMSQSGIELARKAFPKCRFEVASASADLLELLGAEPFDIVISTEVVEHLYDPRAYARTCFTALRGGRVSFAPHPTTATSRTWRSRWQANGIPMRIRCGTAGTSSYGARLR